MSISPGPTDSPPARRSPRTTTPPSKTFRAAPPTRCVPTASPASPLFAGGGKLDNWFNKDAFTTPAGLYGTASRLSIPGPGTVTVDMSLSKSVRFGDTRTLEMRATANNVFNTVHYSGVDSTLGDNTYGEVISTAAMRSFTFMGRYRF